MKPLPWRLLAAVAVLGLGLAWLVLALVYASLPLLPRTAPVSIAVAGLVALVLAPGLRARIERRPGTRPFEPLAVARTVALARAMALAGAAFTGLWAGALLVAVEHLAWRAARADAVTAGTGIAAAIVLVIGAKRLEQACIVPGDRSRRPRR